MCLHLYFCVGVCVSRRGAAAVNARTRNVNYTNTQTDRHTHTHSLEKTGTVSITVSRCNSLSFPAPEKSLFKGSNAD